MRIGILQCGQAPAELKQDMGDYPDMFVRLLDGRGFQFRTWHVEEMEFPESVLDQDGWLLYVALAAMHGFVLLLWTDLGNLDYRIGFLIGAGLQAVGTYFGGREWVFRA